MNSFNKYKHAKKKVIMETNLLSRSNLNII